MNNEILLLTAQHYLHPQQPDWYRQQILDEDALVLDAFRLRNVPVRRSAWDDPSIVSSPPRAAIIRATWDYTERFDEFVRTLTAIAQQTMLINPLSTVLWNLDKHYLRDLFRRGVNIPPTSYIEKGTSGTLAEHSRKCGLTDAILKPVMSAGARHTYRFHGDDTAALESTFRDLVNAEAMMLQPFLSSVVTEGEVTLVMIGGKYSHAVRKRAKEGDFRVQDDFGGTVHPHTPDEAEIRLAEAAMAACDPVPLYGRVDILRDAEGRPAVSELELIEPELWFRFHPASAGVFAGMVHAHLSSL